MKIDEDTLNEMKTFIYDPSLMQVKSLHYLTQGILGDLDIGDPTNPFTFLLENNALTTTSTLHEISSKLRKNYPELSTTKQDLFNHINTSELDNVFASPSSCNFNIYLNKEDLINFGHTVNNITTITIPKYSNIVVDNIYFTLLNDVVITLYTSNNTVFSKYIHNDLSISYNVDSLLHSGIVTDNNDIEWVLIDLTFHQLKRFNFKETLLLSEQFKTSLKFDDNEFFSYADFTTINKNNEIFPLKKTYSNFVFNVDEPTIILKPYDNNLDLEIPLVYNLNNKVSTYLDITAFTTLGELSMPMSHYETNDFIFNMEIPPTVDPTMTGIKNISTYVNSIDFANGGNNELSFIDLKNKIINYSTGDNNLPITITEISDTLRNNNFNYVSMEKNFLESKILATMYLDDLNNDILIKNSTLNSEISFLTSDLDCDKVMTLDNNRIIINPYQMFEMKNKVVNFVNDVHKTKILTTLNEEPLKYNDYNLYFNLFKYILDYDKHLDMRVYDVNQSTVKDINTTYINNEISSTFTIDRRFLIFEENRYVYKIYINIDKTLDSLDYTKIFTQIDFDLYNGDVLSFIGTSEMSDNFLVISTIIPIDGYIDSEGYFRTEVTIDKTITDLLNILNIGTMTLFTTDNNLKINNNVQIDKIVDKDVTSILYEETITFEFATLLDRLYTNYKIDYTLRKYKKYTETEYLTYIKPVYKLDENGIIETTEIVTDDGLTDVEFTILYNIGDYILDDNGNKIVKHNVGDTILDENDLPIIDNDFGIIHKINLFLLEDIYLRVNEPTYSKYRIDFFLKITDVIKNELTTINDNLLENTSIAYISGNQTKEVSLILNNSITKHEIKLKPEITFYIPEDSTINLDDIYIEKIYTFISERILEDFSINLLEKDLLLFLNNDILSIKINLLGDNQLDIIKYKSGSSKFIIDKNIVITDDNLLTLKPNITINTITI